jgi:hypothetical protein
MITIKNGWGPQRLGTRQRKIVERMLRNNNEWSHRWWMCQLDREALNALIKKGIVLKRKRNRVLYYFLNPAFIQERVEIHDDSVYSHCV